MDFIIADKIDNMVGLKAYLENNKNEATEHMFCGELGFFPDKNQKISITNSFRAKGYSTVTFVSTTDVSYVCAFY